MYWNGPDLYLDEGELLANTFLQIDRKGMYYYLLPVAYKKVDPSTTQAEVPTASLCTTQEEKKEGLGNILVDIVVADGAIILFTGTIA